MKSIVVSANEFMMFALLLHLLQINFPVLSPGAVSESVIKEARFPEGFSGTIPQSVIWWTAKT